MDYLPIKYLRIEDKDKVDRELIKLSSLSRNGIPILEGIVFFPPNFKESFKKFFIVDEFSFKHRIKELKKHINTPPSFFLEEIQKYDKKIDSFKLWENLINTWLDDFTKTCKDKGFQIENLNSLKGIPIYFSKKVIAEGVVNVVKDFTYKDNPYDTKIKIEKGKLDSKDLKQLDILAIKAEKILGLGFSFRWVLEEINNEKKIFFASIFHTGHLPAIPVSSSIPFNNPNFNTSASDVRFPVKVLLNQLGEVMPEQLDGTIIETSLLKEDEGLKNTLEFCQKFPESLVLFKITDEELTNSKGLRKKIEELLFLRNKSKFLKVIPLIPASSSVEEFLNTKRDIAVLGITRKASLKLWVEFTRPSNIVSIEEYVLAGIDGVVLNLDFLFKNLFSIDDFQKVSKEKIEIFIKFLEEGLRTLNKLKIPVISTGELIDNDEILKFLVSKGIYGIAISAKRHQIFLMDLPWIHLQAQKKLLS